MPRKPAILARLEGVPVEQVSEEGLKNRHISFKEFVQAVKLQQPREMDIHWRPLHQLLATSLLSYHFVGRFENLNHDMEQMRQRIFPNFRMPIPQAAYPTQAHLRFWDYYDDETVERVAEIYKKDFSEFGYDVNQTPDRC
jgi:hypothetical protein